MNLVNKKTRCEVNTELFGMPIGMISAPLDPPGQSCQQENTIFSRPVNRKMGALSTHVYPIPSCHYYCCRLKLAIQIAIHDCVYTFSLACHIRVCGRLSFIAWQLLKWDEGYLYSNNYELRFDCDCQR